MNKLNFSSFEIANYKLKIEMFNLILLLTNIFYLISCFVLPKYLNSICLLINRI